MKKITIYLAFMMVLPLLLQAQYSGGNGRGDVSISMTNIILPVQKIVVSLSLKYDLSQNYPNPFNPSTNIGYSLKSDSYVMLKVFDALGREVTVLVNGYRKAGIYNETFDASTLAQGVYFYRLSAGDFTDVKKGVLIK